jgi:hypothetical protein
MGKDNEHVLLMIDILRCGDIEIAKEGAFS